MADGKRGLPDRPNDDEQAARALSLFLSLPNPNPNPNSNPPPKNDLGAGALRASAGAACVLARPTFATLDGAPCVRGRVDPVGEPKLVGAFVERPGVEHLLAETAFH